MVKLWTGAIKTDSGAESRLASSLHGGCHMWLWLSKPCWYPILGLCTTHFRLPILVLGLNRMSGGQPIWFLTHGHVTRFSLPSCIQFELAKASSRADLC